MRRLVAFVGYYRLASFWVAVILIVTLVPLEPSEELRSVRCVLCGDGALADDILNVGLFLPLGAALAITGWRPVRAVALGALLSCGIEAAQLMIPSRESSLSDVVFNTVGISTGIIITRLMSRWWPPRPPVAQMLIIVMTLSVWSVLVLTGALVQPAFPNDTYYGGWAHRFGHLEWYGGRVLHVSLDGLEFLPAEHSDSRRVREQLLSGAALHVRARAGPRPPGLAPLFTIHDGHQREILLLGIDGHDIVYRYRTRAIATGFRGPEVRVRDAIRGIAWRDSLEVTVRPVHTGYCIRVNTTEHCGLGFTVGTGWAFLFDDGPSSRWPKTVLDSSWLAVLFFPVGLWARFPWSLPAVVAFSLAFLLIVPTAIGLIPTSTTELLAALIGLLAGFATTVYHFAHDA